ncbi:MAG: efflux transporter periplasmic adaptor subunit [Planctomycetota bacterium]|nr:efflux transporter periplasmic adaptor subunit [Planctomycetota bacterium]
MRKFQLSSDTLRKLLLVPPVVIGAVVLVWVGANAKKPERVAHKEQTRVLRVIKVARCDVLPVVTAYGTAQPGQIWRAIAEVRGRVSSVHDELRPGSILKAGEVVLQIDRTEYDLAITQLNADIAQAQAQLAEREAREKNDQASLVIENDTLKLAEGELNRTRELAKDKAVTSAELDAKTRETLAQRQKVQSINNSLNLVPSQRKALLATIAVKQANLKQAGIDADKTTIATPFACRVGDVSLEVGQFLNAGQVLFEAHGTAMAEVEAAVPVDLAGTLIVPRDSPLGSTLPTMQGVRDLFHIDANVVGTSGSDAVGWDARFLRIRETLDPRTRTIGLVVGVDRPYEKIIPGRRPPLLQGTYCRVTLRGEARTNRVVIPRSAVRGIMERDAATPAASKTGDAANAPQQSAAGKRTGVVYVLDEDDRLRQRAVSIEFTQGSFAVIADGLSGGETLVVSDPTPAVDGLLVEPVVDELLQSDVVAEAGGKHTTFNTANGSPKSKQATQDKGEPQ